MVWLSEGLAETEAEDHFTICEVGDDLAWGPFAWGDGGFNLLRGELADGLVDEAGGAGENGASVLLAQVGGVGVEFHGVERSMIGGDDAGVGFCGLPLIATGLSWMGPPDFFGLPGMQKNRQRQTRIPFGNDKQRIG